VAVKTVKFRLPSDHIEFLKEVNTMNKLHHPNIGLCCRFFNSNQLILARTFSCPTIVVFLGAKVVDKQKGLILLELLMCSLHRAIYFPAEHNVARAEPLLKHEMTLQIAQGLAYLHTALPHITHDDMKPANVMLTDRNVCRIIDFGLSAVKESSRMASHDPRIKAGNGTLHYQAPELLEVGASSKRDHKVDVYAYAVTILSCSSNSRHTRVRWWYATLKRVSIVVNALLWTVRGCRRTLWL
jgi:serine/threonine protein kinase